MNNEFDITKVNSTLAKYPINPHKLIPVEKILPFVKWVGGKRQIVNTLIKKLPYHFNKYYEPFIGGGALLFKLQHKNVVINDLNEELINSYEVIRDSYSELSNYLKFMEFIHDESFYYKVRSLDRDNEIIAGPNSKILRAARFIYLNKACFNGLYRVNSQGKFNVPSGKKEFVKTHDYENLKSISKYLKKYVTIKNTSFEKSLKGIKPGAFVYFDPPYDYEIGSKGFDSYQKTSFGITGQRELAKLCKHLNNKKIKFMVSNHNTKLINNLYKDFNIEVISAKRLIGGKGASRNNVQEVLIRNYYD